MRRSATLITAVRSTQLFQLVAGRHFRELLSHSWSMGWPLIVIMLFEFLVSLTDVYIGGKFGSVVQGAVGFVSQIYFVFIVLANAITVGSVSVAAKIYGSGNKREFSDTVYTLVISVVISGIALAALGFIAAPLIIKKSTIPLPIRSVAEVFISYYLIALVFHYFLINSNGLLRAAKRVKRSLATMSVVATLNIALNLIFYYFSDLGFRGIAISTAASYITGALLNIPAVHSMLLKGKHTFRIDRIKEVFSIGWPMLILQSSWQMGSIVLFLILGTLPTLRVETIAAFTNGLRIEAAIFLPAYALNMSAAAIIANLLGERRVRDAYLSGFVTAAMGSTIIIILSAVVILNAEHLAAALSADPAVVRESMRYLIIQMIAEPFMAFTVILSGALNGAGDTRAVMTIVTSSLWLVRIPLAYLLGIKLGFGPTAVWWAMNTDIFVRTVITTLRYRKRRWQ